MQVKPDLLVVQPTHLDFPLFREQVREHRELFNKIIVVWSNHNVLESMTEWVENSTAKDSITYVDFKRVEKESFADWGQRAISAGLKEVESDWMLISQQDFIAHNEAFFRTVFTDDYQLVSRHGYKNHGCGDGFSRFEPDFIYIHTPIFKQTSMDVSAHPPDHDHWGKISEEFQKLCTTSRTLEELGFFSPNDWEHLQGLCMNYYIIGSGDQAPIYNKERFVDYNKQILASIEEDNIQPSMLTLIKKSANL